MIELISPSSVTEDRVHEFTEYERAGVRKYWLIDPRPYQQQAELPNPQPAPAEIMLRLETLPAGTRAACCALHDLLQNRP